MITRTERRLAKGERARPPGARLIVFSAADGTPVATQQPNGTVTWHRADLVDEVIAGLQPHWALHLELMRMQYPPEPA
jgi:hypothetical protein